MMQSCASAAKLRGGGPILPRGMKAMWDTRVAATSNRHRQTVTLVRDVPKLSCQSRQIAWLGFHSRRTHDDALRNDAIVHEPP